MTRADMYAYFSCCELGRYDFLGFLERFAASDILSVFRGEFSFLSCIHSVCDISNFLPEDILRFSRI